MSTKPDVVITTHGLCKEFGSGGSRVQVLDNIDLQIRSQEFTVIMGPSGSGKSTLLYMLSGMDSPTSGQVTFAGENIGAISPDGLAKFRRRHCGFVFQEILLLEWLSAMDNVLAVGRLIDRPRHELVERADELFDRVGIDSQTQQRFPSMMSGGQSQRVGLVRGLINEPTVVFADEPTGQLNSASSQQVLDLMSGLQGSGHTFMMCTHDLRSALRGDRILYLADGSIQGDLELGPWERDDDTTRRGRLNEFLEDLGW